MKVVWLAPYPVQELGPDIDWRIYKQTLHSCGWIVNLQRALASRPGVELHLLTLHPGVRRSQSLQCDRTHVHVIKSGVPFLHKGWPGRWPVDAMLGYRMESRKLRRALMRIVPDVVHAHGTEREYALAAMRCGYPYLVSIQGIVSEFNRTDPCPFYKIMAPREAAVIRASRYFTCRTHFDTGFVRRLNPDATIFDIPEAMNPGFWRGQWQWNSTARVFFAGGGAQRKGLHELIEAMGRVVREVPNASVDAAGSFSPERRTELQAMADSRGVTIRFHGFKSPEEIAALHRQCDIFTLCSSNENSPNTLAEAMVSGMPCVAYDVGGVSSMFKDGESGLLIHPHDIGSLAGAITKLLSDAAMSTRMGAAAAALGRPRNHPEHVASETLKAYSSILNAKTGANKKA